MTRATPVAQTSHACRERKSEPHYHYILGAYGQVWKCLDKETGRIVAMKRFKEVRA